MASRSCQKGRKPIIGSRTRAATRTGFIIFGSISLPAERRAPDANSKLRALERQVSCNYFYELSA